MIKIIANCNIELIVIWLNTAKWIDFGDPWNANKTHTLHTCYISPKLTHDTTHIHYPSRCAFEIKYIIYIYMCCSFKLPWAFSSTFTHCAENRHACTQTRQHYVTSHRNQKAFHITSSDAFVFVCACRRGFSPLLTFMSLGVLQPFVTRFIFESTCYCSRYLPAAKVKLNFIQYINIFIHILWSSKRFQ